MRILLTSLCIAAIGCDERPPAEAEHDIEITGADAIWASDIWISKHSISSLVDWPVHAVGIVIIGEDGAVIRELNPFHLAPSEAFPNDTIIRVAITQDDHLVKCRLGVGGYTRGHLLEDEFAQFGGFTGNCAPVDGIVVVATEGDIISNDGEVMLSSSGKKLGFKLYKQWPKQTTAD